MSERARILHSADWQGVFYVTGGGSLLISELLTTPGASASVLEARVPYAAAALADLLGRAPDQACSDSTARAMAILRSPDDTETPNVFSTLSISSRETSG